MQEKINYKSKILSREVEEKQSERIFQNGIKKSRKQEFGKVVDLPWWQESVTWEMCEVKESIS